jgi:hypothetical protein
VVDAKPCRSLDLPTVAAGLCESQTSHMSAMIGSNGAEGSSGREMFTRARAREVKIVKFSTSAVALGELQKGFT